MAEHSVFNRETLLDTLVNVVPLGILAFFFLVFLLVNPWTGGPRLQGVLQILLVLVPFVLLALLTYETAKRI